MDGCSPQKSTTANWGESDFVSYHIIIFKTPTCNKITGHTKKQESMAHS